MRPSNLSVSLKSVCLAFGSVSETLLPARGTQWRWGGLLLLLILGPACEPKVLEAPVQQPVVDTPPALKEAEQKFAFDVEASKALAMREFPELKVAGSRMNLAFLDEVALLRRNHSPELDRSNWPYLAACRASSNIAKDEQQKKVLEAQKPKSSYCARDLKLVLQLPEDDIRVSGRVTKIDTVLGKRAVAIVHIDSVISFELDRTPSDKLGSKVSFMSKEGKLLEVIRDNSERTIREQVVLQIGQQISVFGRCIRMKNGTFLIQVAPGGGQLGYH